MKKYAQLLIFFYGIFLIPLFVSAQQRFISGVVVNSLTNKAIPNVYVTEPKSGNQVLTDTNGFFRVEFPFKSRELLLSKKQYFTFQYRLPWGQPVPKNITLHLKPLNYKEVDTIWRSNKNVVTLIVNELLTGAVAFRYELFIGKKHSVGINSSFYFYGFNNFLLDLGNNSVSFNGIKPAPFYRYYPIRSNSGGAYLEAKVPFGHFNFNRLTYDYADYYFRNIPQQFWTVGGAVSFGYMFRLGESRHGVGNISVGIQVFPMNVPTTSEQDLSGETVSFELNNTWWYITGPGSFFEVKLSFGGLF